MKKNFNINSYLVEAEREFSGFENQNGYAEDLNGVEGIGMTPQPANIAPTPYSVNITNSTAGTLNAILFGKNKYLLSTNYGSPVGITIAPSQTNISYLMLLQQSAEQPFETSFMRILSTSNPQVNQVITVTSFDANGQSCDIPIMLSSFFSPNQFQDGMVDIPLNMKIDGNTYFTFPILAGLTVTMTFFPRNKVNPSRALNGQSQVRPYGAPSVAIGIPTVNVGTGLAKM
jgi:hypothetical protein